MRALLLALLLAPVAPARAGFWRHADLLKLPREHFEAGRHQALVDALTPEAFQKLSSPELRWAYLHLGTSLERLGRQEQALGVYQLGIRLFPKDINLLTKLGDLLHRVGLEEQAEPLYERVLKIHPRNAAANLGLAQIDRALGLLESSALHFERALEELGDSAPAWRDYAEVLLDSRDYKTAESAIRKSLGIAEDPDTLADLARIERASGRLDAALGSLARAAALAPGRGDIALTRGLWLLEAGRYDEALRTAEAALKADPRDPLARWIRARVHLKADRYNAAVADLSAAAAAQEKAPFVARAAAALLSRLQGTRK